MMFVNNKKAVLRLSCIRQHLCAFSTTANIKTKDASASSPAATLRAYEKGAPCPPLKSGVLRLYGMRFCPYVQRTKLVLEYKSIPHETINVNLRRKPDWLFARNPNGLVPVLEIDGLVLYESTATCDWLDEVFPHKRLTPSDPVRRAKDRMLLEYFGKVISNFHSAVKHSDQLDERLRRMTKHVQHLEDELAWRGGPFLGGPNPAMIDFLLWPHMERMPVLPEMTGDQRFDIRNQPQFPKVAAWFEAMYELPAVKATIFDVTSHMHFLKGLMAGNADYDYGL